MFIVCPTASKYFYIKKEGWRERGNGEGKEKGWKRGEVEGEELRNEREERERKERVNSVFFCLKVFFFFILHSWSQSKHPQT